MSHSYQDSYTELLSLARDYIAQEFAQSDWKVTDPDTFAYYKNFALQQRSQGAAPMPNVKPAAVTYSAQQVNIIRETAVELPFKSAPVISTPIPAPTSKKTTLAKAQVPVKEVASKEFTLEPLQKPQEIELNDIQKLVVDRYPGKLIINEIPSDEEAKQMNAEWKQELVIPEVIILSFNESLEQQLLLQNIAKAIQASLAPAAMIPAVKLEQQWEKVLKTKSLKLIIATSHGLQTSPTLWKQYREAQKQAKHFLGDVPLYMLSDLSIYLKNPQLKVPVWQDLKKMLGK